MRLLVLFLLTLLQGFGYELIPNSESAASVTPILRTDGKGNSLAFWGTKYSFLRANGEFITSDQLTDSAATAGFFNACFDSKQNLLLVWKNGNELKYTYKKAGEITSESNVKSLALDFLPEKSVIRYSKQTNSFYLQIAANNKNIYFLQLQASELSTISSPVLISSLTYLQQGFFWFDIDEKGNALFVNSTQEGGSYKNGKIILVYKPVNGQVSSPTTLSLGPNVGIDNLFVFYNTQSSTAYWFIGYNHYSSSEKSFQGFVANQDLSYISLQRVISSPLLSQKNEGGNVTLSKKSNNLMLFMKEEKNQIFYSWFKPTSLAYDSLNLNYKSVAGSNKLSQTPRSSLYSKKGAVYFTFINDPLYNPNIAYSYLSLDNFTFSVIVKNLGPINSKYLSIVPISSATSRIIWSFQPTTSSPSTFLGIYTTRAVFPFASNRSTVHLLKGVN